MIPVSNSFRQEMETNRLFRCWAAMTLASGTVLNLTAGDFDVDTNEMIDGPGASGLPVGAAFARGITITLDNRDERYADVDFFGAVIRFGLSLTVSGTEETVALGYYTVNQPATYGESVTISAVDYMSKADKPFTTALTFPAMARALWVEMCTSCGITDGMSAIPEGDFVIRTAPGGELTFRAVFGYIAMLSGGNARIDRLGRIVVVNYDFTTLAAEREAGTADGIQDLTAWIDLTTDTQDVVITGVQTTTDDGTLLEGAAGYVLNLDNPLAAGNEADFLKRAADALVGGRLRRFSGQCPAYPLAEFGDPCRVTDRKGNHCYTVITDADFVFFDATALSCSAESPLTTGAAYTPPDARAIQKAREMVKAEQTAREAAVAALAQALNAAGGMYETTEAATGGGTIYYLHDKPTLAASAIVLKLTAEALGISTDGGQTYPTGWNFATSTTITNILNTIGINADWINAGSLEVRDANGHILFKADKDSRLVTIGGLLAGYGLMADYQNLFSLQGATVIKLVGEEIGVTYNTQYGPGGIEFSFNDDRVTPVDENGQPIETDNSRVYYIKSGDVLGLDPGLSGFTIGSDDAIYIRVPTANDFVVESDPEHGIYSERHLLTEMGTLSSLSTTAKTSLVAAINEVDGDLATLLGSVGNTAVTNLNTTLDYGFHVYSRNATGAPTTAGGGLLVTGNGTWVYQTAFVYNTANVPTIYDRTYVSGAWGDWTRRPARAEITSINSSITALNGLFSQTRTQPTVSTVSGTARATNIQGGYLQLGNLVFVSMFFQSAIAVTGGWNTFFTGFPTPATARAALAVHGTGSNAPHIQAEISNDTRSLRLYGTVASGESIAVSGFYYTA